MLQNTWDGSIWGAGGGQSLPSTLLHLSGTIRDEAVDWAAGATCVAIVMMAVGSSAVTTDTQISGGLWATATGLKFTDGANVSPLPCTWAAGDKLVIALEIVASGTMIIKRLES